ncbi:MAG: amidohydrolase family protein, partial [Woeseiaceae bacterium]|nr:amidohydrolase family protein [Woeseiaceae bacterium]
RASREEIWRCIQNGTFQVYSSDHAPYRMDDTGKFTAGPKPDFRKIANGLPGIELRLPLLFSEGFMKGRITLNHFVQLAAGNVSRIYGLDDRKGSITEGKDADIAIWDPEARRTVTAADLHDNMDYTPYEGMSIEGWPVTVIRRGQVIVDGGELLADRGSGEFLRRKTIDCTGMPGELAPELDRSRNFDTDLGL